MSLESSTCIGASASRLGEIVTHLKTLVRDARRLYPIHGQAAAFLDLYGDRVGPRQRALAEALVASRRSLAARLRFAASGPIVRSRPLDGLASRLLIAAGLY